MLDASKAPVKGDVVYEGVLNADKETKGKLVYKNDDIQGQYLPKILFAEHRPVQLRVKITVE